jgi:hypothetical protein
MFIVDIEDKMKLVLTPDWFLGKDVIIESFSFIVLFVFFLLCWRYYKLSKKKSLLYLGIGFLLIALAQIATILTKLVLYYDTTFTHQIGQMIVTYQFLKSVDIFYQFGFFFERLLTLLGFYVIYKLSLKKKWTGDSYLVLYFLILTSFFSAGLYYYIFHLTALLLILLIIKNYSQIYRKNKNMNTKILVIAFSLLALSQLIYILAKLSTLFVIANLIGLASYIILLLLIIRILKQVRNINK